ncbi:MAG TPA: glycosyltransferase [Micromonosporaceae bacterium]|nr:glycosyltransferase [Micromonosporaceae bacterium]
MRILISLFRLAIGGSQINAIEIGARLAQAAHEVIVYGPDGVLRERISSLDLEYVPAGAARRGHPPTLAGVRSLTALAKRRRVDLIHAYEWAPTLEAAYGPHLRLGVPVLSTIYSVGVPRFVPRNLPMIVGYLNEADLERRRGRRIVHVVMCPVDTVANAPVADCRSARRRFGFADENLVAVVVSRLARDLKREGILAAIAAVGQVDAAHNLRLLVVGDGPCRQEVQLSADRVNARVGHQAVTLTGQLLDPRDAYAAADIVLGMGTSAQKGMAFGKPVVIQGERGYWDLLTPATLPTYVRQNFYGVGDGSDGAPRLAGILADLAGQRSRWPELGAFGRQTALSAFSNDVATEQVIAICEDVAGRREPARRRAAGVITASGWFAGFRAVDLAHRAAARPHRTAVARG